MEGYCCTKIRLQSDCSHASGVTGDYKIMFNIEDDCVTCNSYVVFSQIKKPSQDHFFLYVDRHGNWVVGSDVGKARGVLRSSPEEGQHLECPCQVSSWYCWDPDTKSWTEDQSVLITKYKLYSAGY